MNIIDFSTPQWLITSYKIMSISSIILNSIGIYLTVFQCKQLGVYRYFLLFFQISCIVADFHMSYLMQPVPLFPILSGYTMGILNHFMDKSMEIEIIFIFFANVITLETLLACFENKHQSLAKVLRRNVLPTWFLIFAYSMTVVSPFIGGFWLLSMIPSKEEQQVYLQETYPEYLDNFNKLPNFMIFKKSKSFDYFLNFLFISGLIAVVSFVALSIDIFLIMNIVKAKISKTNYQRHRHAVRSLQVSMASSLVFISPPAFVISMLVLRTENTQFLTEIAMAVVCTHGSVNILSMIFFFPPYRVFLEGFLRRNQRTGQINSMATRY